MQINYKNLYALLVLSTLMEGLKAQSGKDLITTTTSSNLIGKVKKISSQNINGQIINGVYTNGPIPQQKNVLHFDSLGKLIEYSYDLDVKGVYKYNEKGLIISHRKIENSKSELTTYEYDTQDNIINEIYVKTNDTSFTSRKYDQLNNLTEFESHSKVTRDGKQNLYFNKESYVYNRKLLTQKNIYYSENKIGKIVKYFYNNRDKIIRETSRELDVLDSITTFFKYDADSTTLVKESKIDFSHVEFLTKTYEYSDSGRTKIEKEYYTDSTTHSTSIVKFDKLKNIIANTYYGKDKLLLNIKYSKKFNKKGLLVETVQAEYSPDNKLLLKRIHKYIHDSQNNIIKDYLIVGNSFTLVENEISYY